MGIAAVGRDQPGAVDSGPNYPQSEVIRAIMLDGSPCLPRGHRGTHHQNEWCGKKLIVFQLSFWVIMMS